MGEQPRPAPTPEEQPLWKLDRGEKRVLFITFVGGLASLIAAAVIIGGGIALAHAWFGLKSHTAAGNVVGTVTLIVAILVVVGLPISVRVLQNGKRLARSVAWVVIWVAVLYSAVVSLAVIGLAAGVH
jgi:hypothetical protein